MIPATRVCSLPRRQQCCPVLISRPCAASLRPEEYPRGRCLQDQPRLCPPPPETLPSILSTFCPSERLCVFSPMEFLFDPLGTVPGSSLRRLYSRKRNSRKSKSPKAQ